jgi:NifU-like protein
MDTQLTPYPWYQYSGRLLRKIEQPYCAGTFAAIQTQQEGVRLVIGKEFDPSGTCWLSLHWLVDETDGVILDARFLCQGASSLVGAAQVACEMLAGKSYAQAQRITADHLDHYIRDKKETPAFPESVGSDLNLVIDAISLAALECQDINLHPSMTPPPTPVVSSTGSLLTESSPEWVIANYEGKIQLIEQVLDEHIRPYVALDEGGIEVVKLIEEQELLIRYQGACTSCASSTGSTLMAVQEILRQHLSPHLIVVPDLTQKLITPST